MMEPQHCFFDALVHVLQIGLGTNNTFLDIDSMSSEAVFFLNAATHASEERLRGIGVDPCAESARPLRRQAERMNQTQDCQISVVQGSVGEFAGLRTVFCLPEDTLTKMQKEMVARSIEPSVRKEVEKEMCYLENMSSMDAPLPDFVWYVDYIRRLSGIDIPMLEKRDVRCHTFQDILSMHQTRGCQVLLVDAEGSDCAILRSMMKTCNGGETPWPWVIHFETAGHCDIKELGEVEEQTVKDLQEKGYLLVHAYRNSTLLHGPSLHAEHRLASWADWHFTLTCDSCGFWAQPSHRNFKEHVGTGFGQWQSSDRGPRRWYCKSCCKR